MTEKSTKVLESFGPRAMARGAKAVLCAAVLLASVSLLRAGTGTVDIPAGWYVAGTNITAKAIPEQFSKFDGWGGDTGGASISNKQIAIDVNNSMLITARFSEMVTSTNAVPHRWLAAQDPTWTNDFESAVTNDWDTDGYTTGQEYWSGTDPTNDASFLHIEETYLTSTNMRLIWSHAKVDPDIHAICIQSRASLSTGDWVYADEKMPVDGTNFWDALIQMKGFYRLSVTNVP